MALPSASGEQKECARNIEELTQGKPEKADEPF